MKTNIFVLLTLLVFGASFIIRWWNIATIPYGIEEDEYAWVALSRFEQIHIDPLAKGIWPLHLSNYNNYPISAWLNQLSFVIFGVDIIAPRKFLVFYSTGSLVIFWLLVRRFFDKYIALGITTLYAFSTYKLVTSRIALQPSYEELPVLTALLCICYIPSILGWRAYIVALTAGILIAIALLTYNLAYTAPLIALGFFLFSIGSQAMSRKRMVGLVCSFLLSMSVFLPHIIPALQREYLSKQYIFDQSETPTNVPTASRVFATLTAHVTSSFTMAWQPLVYPNADMLVGYPAPLVPHSVVLVAILGLLWALVEYRRYWPLIWWFLCQFMVYHIILGFNFPRNWFMTVSSVYILAAIPFQQLISSRSFRVLFSSMSIFLLVYLLISGVEMYFIEAIHHQSYRIFVREAFDLSEKYHIAPNSQTIIVPNVDPFRLNTWLSAAAFSNSKRATFSTLHGLNRQDFGILTFEEWSNKMNTLPPCFTFISTPQEVTRVKSFLALRCQEPYRLEKFKEYWVLSPTNFQRR